MCLIVFAWQAHEHYPLIIAANRDEFYARPSSAAHLWDHPQAILAGRDLEAGGTWLGVNRLGRVAAVTNVREGFQSAASAASRGNLPLRYLSSDRSLEHTTRDLASEADRYNGFNLLLGNTHQMSCLSNRELSDREDLQVRAISAGVHGLSNATLDTPWPKVESARRELSSLLMADWRQLDSRRRDLFHLLSDATTPEDHLLPDTGVSLEWERLLSSRFISSDTYGTRTSTILLVDKRGHVDFMERSFHDSVMTGERHFHFLIEDE